MDGDYDGYDSSDGSSASDDHDDHDDQSSRSDADRPQPRDDSSLADVRKSVRAQKDAAKGISTDQRQNRDDLRRDQTPAAQDRSPGRSAPAVHWSRDPGIAQHAAMAERNGTTFARAVNDYVAVETEIRKDFLGGIEYLCRRLGVQPQALLAGLAQRYGGQRQPQYSQPRPPTHAEVRAQQTALNKQIEEFGSKTMLFPEARKQMAQFVQAGHANDLQSAYDLVLKYNPTLAASRKTLESWGGH
jgi:hypothetical protein